MGEKGNDRRKESCALTSDGGKRILKLLDVGRLANDNLDVSSPSVSLSSTVAASRCLGNVMLSS